MNPRLEAVGLLLLLQGWLDLVFFALVLELGIKVFLNLRSFLCVAHRWVSNAASLLHQIRSTEQLLELTHCS